MHGLKKRRNREQDVCLGASQVGSTSALVPPPPARPPKFAHLAVSRLQARLLGLLATPESAGFLLSRAEALASSAGDAQHSRSELLSVLGRLEDLKTIEDRRKFAMERDVQGMTNMEKGVSSVSSGGSGSSGSRWTADSTRSRLLHDHSPSSMPERCHTHKVYLCQCMSAGTDTRGHTHDAASQAVLKSPTAFQDVGAP